MLDFTPRFPDQITIDYGPRDLLARFFLLADRECRNRGIYLSLSSDPHEMLRVNEVNRDTWGMLVPMFDPTKNALKSDAFFWLKGFNEVGEVVASQGARFHLWDGTTLKHELESLRFFYADPSERVAAGEHYIVDAPAARRITGRNAFSGGTWARPDMRGQKLSALLPRISRAYALTRWRTEFSFSFVSPVLIEKGVVANYGYTKTEGAVGFRNCSFRPDGDLHLILKTEAEIIEDCRAFVEQYGDAEDQAGKWNRVRRYEVPETNISPLSVSHGRTRRS
jgi:hypothetical protein